MNWPFKLLWKLLVINWLSLAIVLLTIRLAVHQLAADYFMTLMQDYNISPSDANAMFLQATNRYFLISSVVGLGVASLLSVWLNYRLTAPISQIIRSAELISGGDYSQRVKARGCGEIDELTDSFNDMAGHLQRAERLRKDFIVDVAHELRTPLTNILGYMEGLRDDVVSPDKALYSSLHEEAQRLVHLVEELLQLARADVARSDLNLERIDLSQIIRQTAHQFQPKLTARSLALTYHAADSIEIHADAFRMIQVLTNLFENACRYAPTGSQVDVHVDRHPNSVRVRMLNDADNEVSNPELIFERFQRGDTSRSRRSGGAGLGLAIVKELIRAHGGTVGSQFRAGKAEFWFELPLTS